MEMTKLKENVAAVDQFAMLFPNLIEMVHPHVPLTAKLQVSEISKSLAPVTKSLKPEEKQSTLEVARFLIAYGQAMEESCKQ